MRNLSSLALCFSLAVSSPCVAGTLIPVVPVSGATYTDAAGINDDNVIVGEYGDNNGLHAFVGTLDGNYTTFDVKGATRTDPSSISDLGNIVGNSDLGAFEASESGSYSIIGVGKKHKPLDKETAYGINNNGEFVGYYYDDKAAAYRGYYGSGSSYNSDFNLNVSNSGTFPMGINKSGWVVGYALLDVDKTYHAFLYKNGSPTFIDYPAAGAYGTTPRAINDNGLVTGFYQSNGKTYGFFYDATKEKFSTLRVKKAKQVSIGGINNAGYATVVTDRGSFIYCPLKKNQCRS